jgi:hypothetical protein
LIPGNSVTFKKNHSKSHQKFEVLEFIGPESQSLKMFKMTAEAGNCCGRVRIEIFSLYSFDPFSHLIIK